jgi:hypothetical protein
MKKTRRSLFALAAAAIVSRFKPKKPKGEVPAILERGEHVMTAREGKIIINRLDKDKLKGVLALYPDAILKIIQKDGVNVRRLIRGA